MDSKELEAWEFLHNPGIITEIEDDLTKLGVIGEKEVKLITYLVAISRKLIPSQFIRPLALILIGSPSSGKSLIIDSVVKLIPDEEKLVLSQLSPKGLAYIDSDLSHKLLVVSEGEGAEEARYQLRGLISESRISLQTPSGRREVNGPIAYMETRSKSIKDIGADFPSRALIVQMDETPQQTMKIHEAMKRRVASASSQNEADLIIQKHKIAQMLLCSVRVRIPYAPQIEFPHEKLENRRDLSQFFSLIAAIALLCQFQPRRRSEGTIWATKHDYEIAHNLFCRVLESHAAQELGPITHELYLQVRSKLGGKFTRNKVQDLGYSAEQTRKHLEKLEQHGYIQKIEGGGRGKQILYQTMTLDQITPPERIIEEVDDEFGD